jgi:hypothetical protein
MTSKTTKILFFFSVIGFVFRIGSLNAQEYVSTIAQPGDFKIADQNSTCSIYTDTSDDWLIQKTASLFQDDLEKVTGKKPAIIHVIPASARNLIIIGSITQSKVLQQLIRSKKISVYSISNQWEAYQIEIVNHPLKGIDKALIIAGSDRRGTAYGVFELSKQIGVSPWYWWADVPVKKKDAIYIRKNIFVHAYPLVKYRAIFLNDEAPALSGWVHEKFGNFNHLFYEKVFELLLRLKANYLWPAMWGNAFNNDDSLNPVLANKYGIVMGTSHQEPMDQATEHWRHQHKGAWNYQTNDSTLRAFWRKGIENMDHRETIVTLGMRGDGDKPMTEGSNIALLEKIVADQRKIIADVTGRPASETPQDWALYKEVQDYYDKGMRVPGDVTLLFSDDNWGNLRRVPSLNAKPRSGGYGIYYHFDYVGGPRNYKWINTNNIAKVWEQLNIAYQYGIRKIWIVNVGDLKPMEFPISFFMDYAWNPQKITVDNLPDYYANWAARQFGNKYAKEIGQLIQKYSQYNARRKPELLSPETYSLTDYNEFQRVVNNYNKLVVKAQKINNFLAEKYRDAFFELVLHPIEASANLNALYLAVAKNRFFAKENNPEANLFADSVKYFFRRDSLISYKYNHEIANGKWDHMMDPTHIGYTYWQQPRYNKMPEVTYISKDSSASRGVKVDVKNVTAKGLIPKNPKGNIFYEKNGYVSLEAPDYTKEVSTKDIKWKVIPGIGRNGSGITTFPVTANKKTFSNNNPHLEYSFYTYDSGSFQLNTYFSPTLNFLHDSAGLEYAISVDNEKPQIISINKDDANPRIWGRWVANDIIIKTTNHSVEKKGKHVIKYWMISPGVVLEKIVADFGGEKPSYLGPPETLFKHVSK